MTSVIPSNLHNLIESHLQKVVKEGSPMTMDVRHDRVRVMVDNAGIVTRAPRIG